MNLTQEEFLSRFRGTAHCQSCDHLDQDIKPATCFEDDDDGVSFIFGSDADFCTNCEEPWTMNSALRDLEGNVS